MLCYVQAKFLIAFCAMFDGVNDPVTDKLTNPGSKPTDPERQQHGRRVEGGAFGRQAT